MLEYYGKRLNAVEINSTFYRMPSREVLADWASKVPSDFSFILKASRKITHNKRLKDAEEELAHLVDVSGELAGRRGPILFQLPPYFKKDVERLRDFGVCYRRVSWPPSGFAIGRGSRRRSTRCSPMGVWRSSSQIRARRTVTPLVAPQRPTGMHVSARRPMSRES